MGKKNLLEGYDWIEYGYYKWQLGAHAKLADEEVTAWFNDL